MTKFVYIIYVSRIVKNNCLYGKVAQRDTERAYANGFLKKPVVFILCAKNRIITKLRRRYRGLRQSPQNILCYDFTFYVKISKMRTHLGKGLKITVTPWHTQFIAKISNFPAF